MIKLILTLNLLFIPVTLKAQPDTSWFKIIGGKYADRFYSSALTADGGVILAGASIASIFDNKGAWLVKADSAGNVLWSKTYGTEVNAEAQDVIEYSAGGYVVLGFARIPGVGGTDFYAVRTDSIGDTLWIRHFGLPGVGDAGISLVETSEQNIIFSGYMRIEGLDDQMALVWTDPFGDTLMTRTYGGTGQEAGKTIIRTSNGGYLVGGWTDSFGNGELDFWIVRIDELGDTLWTQTYGGGQRDKFEKLIETSDGGFALIGSTESFGEGGSDIYLIKTDSTGEMQFSRTFGGKYKDVGLDIKEVIGGGYIISGWSASFDPLDRTGANPYIIRTDASGDTIWTYIMADRWGKAYSIHNTAKARYLVAGVTEPISPFDGGMLMEFIAYPYSIIRSDTMWLDSDFDGYAEGSLDGTESYNAEGYEVISYEWRLNGSLIGTDPIVTYILPTGIHTVTLTVTDENGYTGTKVKEITVAAYKTKLVEGISSILTSSGDSIFFGYTESNVIQKFNFLGEPEWNIQLNNKIQSALTSGNNGVLYAATEDSGIYAFDQAGDLLFSVSVGRINNISPALSTDGTLYIGNLAGALYSINSDDGSINWIENIGMVLLFSPVVSKDGTIYVNGPDKNLLAMNLDGSEKWRFDPGSWIFSSPALDGSGNLYFGSNNHNLYKLSPLGDEIWSVELSSPVWGAPVLGVNGSVYVESSDGIVHALSASGAPLWRYNTGNKPERISPGNPVVLSDGRIALFNSDNTLLLLDQDGNVDWSFKSDGALTQPPLITVNGLISFASSDDYLYGLVPPDYVAGNLSSWHTFQGNNQRTGYQGTIVSVKDNKTETLPREYSLEQNYPNPFNPVTQINYSLPRAVHVSLSIYDLRGQLVVNLVDETHPAGEYSLLFDAAELSSGIYFYRITTDDFIKTKKMVILK